MWPFDELDLSPTSDIRQIKRAYAKRLKVTRPDDDPVAFQSLHDAYRAALEQAEAGTLADPQQTAEEEQDSPGVIQTEKPQADLSQDAGEPPERSEDREPIQASPYRSSTEIAQEILSFASTHTATELHAWLGGHPALWSLQRKEAIRAELWHALHAAPVVLESENIEVLFSDFQLDGDGEPEHLQHALHLRCQLLVYTVMRTSASGITLRAAESLKSRLNTDMKPQQLARALHFFLHPQGRFPHIPRLDPPYAHIEEAAQILAFLNPPALQDPVVFENLEYWTKVIQRKAPFWKLQFQQAGMAAILNFILALGFGAFSTHTSFWGATFKFFFILFSIAVAFRCLTLLETNVALWLRFESWHANDIPDKTWKRYLHFLLVPSILLIALIGYGFGLKVFSGALIIQGLLLGWHRLYHRTAGPPKGWRRRLAFHLPWLGALVFINQVGSRIDIIPTLFAYAVIIWICGYALRSGSTSRPHP